MSDTVDPTPENSDVPTTPIDDMPPVEMDAATQRLLAQMKAMQQQIDALHAAQPPAPNMVAAAVKDLTEHVNARAAQYPDVDFSEVRDALGNLAKEAESHPSEVASLVKEVVHELADIHPGKEFAYLRELATKFVKTNLKALAGI